MLKKGRYQMSVQIKLRLKGHVSVQDLLDFLQEYHPVPHIIHMDCATPPAEVQWEYKIYHGDKWYMDNGFIELCVPDSGLRNLSYDYSNVKAYALHALFFFQKKIMRNTHIAFVKILFKW